MNVLVTGATGFLGRHVVAALRRRGHAVRAVVRPSTDAALLPVDVELFRADLRVSRDLPAAFEGIDVVVHLAATVLADDESRFASTVVGTERLLDAMAATTTRRVVLAGSFASYDWGRVRGALNESSPLAGDGPTPADRRRLYDRDGYAVAKVWQERVARRMAERHGWDLTVLRPGILWGRGNADLSALIGPPLGRLQLVIGPSRELPLSHVENCADAFVRACECPAAAGPSARTFNVTDGHGVSAWRYAGDSAGRLGIRRVRVPVPYAVGLAVARAATAVSRLIFGPGGKLPSLLVPSRFQARFRPLKFDRTETTERLGWVPDLNYAAAKERTFNLQRPHDVSA